MRRLLRAGGVVAINAVVFLAMLGAIELYFRMRPPPASVFAEQSGLWPRFQAYVMHLTAPGSYRAWDNRLTGERYPANVVTNSLGFNDNHELSYTNPYDKAPN